MASADMPAPGPLHTLFSRPVEGLRRDDNVEGRFFFLGGGWGWVEGSSKDGDDGEWRV